MAAPASWTLSWWQRPPEEAAHFNPAFCGELLARAVRSYHAGRHSLMSLPLIFVVLPLALHARTRHALPRRATTTFVSWSMDHEAILNEVPDRVLGLRPITREALLFMCQLKALALSSEGVSTGPKPLRLSSRPDVTSDDADEARRAATFLGRWFAYQPMPGAVLQTMGVTV